MKTLPQMKGKGMVTTSAITADQMSTAGPVWYCVDIIPAMKTPWMVHWVSITVSLDNFVKNYSWKRWKME